MTAYESAITLMTSKPRRFLVTGAAGFIGSNLVEALLRLEQEVVAFDNLLTGHEENLHKALRAAGSNGDKFRFIKADARDLDACKAATEGIDIVLHNAALGSVPRSIENPIATHTCNVDGFINVLEAARLAGVQRFVFASSSSVYGDNPSLPKIEHEIGKPLSPYALTKSIDEQYAQVFAKTYGNDIIGLRYFNVFGRRQDPNGPYAAVIPKWLDALMAGEPVQINGDGETSRDFCYIENVVQANLLAATTENPSAMGEVFNVAFGQSTTLNALYRALVENLKQCGKLGSDDPEPRYVDFRKGDVRHSLADISKAKELLGYQPAFSINDGLREYVSALVAN
jgi:UDP-N-acetylglucosamine/UDP-N-acetylgalactosamine 4-epimerase